MNLGSVSARLRQTEAMFIAPVDATLGETEWRPFVEAHPFGHLVAPGGPAREMPVVVPTQFVLADDTVWLHLVRANPVFAALAENPRVLLSVADDWAFIPSSWKAVGDEDPVARDPDDLLRRGAARRHGDGARRAHVTGHVVAAILRRQLATFQPDDEVADPGEAHAARAVRDPRHRDRSGAGVGQVQVRRQRRRARTAGPWWSGYGAAVARATTPRPGTSCDGWETRRKRIRVKRMRVQKRRGRAGRGGSAITRGQSAVTRPSLDGGGQVGEGRFHLLRGVCRAVVAHGPCRRRRTTACGGPPTTR